MKFLKRRSLQAVLMRWRLGRWLLIGFYKTYLDQFARVWRATEDYNLRGDRRRMSLRFRLHRSIHRLEKGLTLYPRRAGFGRENLAELIGLMTQWREVGPETYPTYVWGQQVLQAYRRTLEADMQAAQPDERKRLDGLHAELSPAFNTFALNGHQNGDLLLRWAEIPRTLDVNGYSTLLEARKSIRRWLDEPVPQAVIEQAMEHALRAPSACNRQPFGVVAIRDREKLRQAASLLTGGGGFAEQAPLLLVLTSDFGAYGGHEQRNLAYIDGGLAAMAFLLSLTAQGYATVPMNWSVEVERDVKLRCLIGLEETQVVLFMVGVGVPHPDALIPSSARRPVSETLQWI